MEGFRSRSYNDGRMQLQAYGGRPPPPPSGTYDFRSYSMSNASSAGPGSGYGGYGSRDVKFDKGKGASGSSTKGWVFSDPEFQRKKRVASYKVYAVEGRMKGSIRRSFRWLKDKYTQVVYGWW